MKNTLVLYLFLFPTLCFGQYQYLKNESSQVTFEKVYQIDSLNAAKIKTMLLSELPKIRGFKNLQVSDEVIMAKLIDYTVNAQNQKKPNILNNPFFADVSIFWKDGKYKVLLSNMYVVGMSMKFPVSDMLLKKGDWWQNKSVLNVGNILQADLEKTFTVNQKSDW